MNQPQMDIPVRAPSATSADDTVLPFEIGALDLRGRVVRLGSAVDTILNQKSINVEGALAPGVGAKDLILHIIGATLWLGGLAAVVVYALADGRWRALAVRRFSRVAFWCILVVGASGVVNALVRVPLGDLFTDTYGRLVVAKVVALVVLGLVALLVARARAVETQMAAPVSAGADISQQLQAAQEAMQVALQLQGQIIQFSMATSISSSLGNNLNSFLKGA